MLKVETYLAKSKIHGLGVFAKEFIPKYTVVWYFDDNFDISVHVNEWKRLIKVFKKIFPKSNLNDQIWEDDNKMIYLCCDNARYINHDPINNNLTVAIRNKLLVSNRNIEVGEELTENYIDAYSKKLVKISDNKYINIETGRKVNVNKA